MTEEEQQRIIAEGRDARALRENPALEKCFKMTLDHIFAQFCASGYDDYETRERLWAVSEALQQFKSVVDATIAEGAVEEMNRDEDRKQQTSFRSGPSGTV